MGNRQPKAKLAKILSQNKKHLFLPKTYKLTTEVIKLCNKFVKGYLLYVNEHIGTSGAAGEMWRVLFATEVVFDGFLLAATRYHVIVELAPL